MMYTNAEEIGITDGICMFLVDATTNEYIGSNLKYGAEGAGFGYAPPLRHTDIRYGVTSITGMKGGYLAVALDQGHFKNWRFENYEMRNGIPDGDAGIANVQSATYNTRSNVTIRGRGKRRKGDNHFAQNSPDSGRSLGLSCSHYSSHGMG